MMHAVRAWVIPAYCALSLFLGGSAQAVWGNLLLQLCALVIIGWSLLAGRADELSRFPRVLPWLVVLLLALQLIPLPPLVWTALPGRGEVARGFVEQGRELPWLPLSLAPYDTIAAALMLLLPLAAFVGMTMLGAFRVRHLLVVLVGAAALHAGLGILQVAGGGAWYPYTFTNPDAATGFFANANHLASLLLASMPFLAAAIALQRGTPNGPAVRIAAAAVAALILLALLLTRSSAGMLLAIPAAGASILLVRPTLMPHRRLLALTGLVMAVAGGALVATGAVSTASSSRQQIWSNTAALAAAYAPVGSGLGTFEQVYRLAEDPAAVDRTFVNRAHNDYLQLALETGVPGMLLLGLFLAWWLKRTVALWRPGHGAPYARAATIASASLLAHSLVDYPLRTGANSVVLAICLALMCGARPRALAPSRPLRHLSA